MFKLFIIGFLEKLYKLKKSNHSGIWQIVGKMKKPNFAVFWPNGLGP